MSGEGFAGVRRWRGFGVLRRAKPLKRGTPATSTLFPLRPAKPVCHRRRATVRAVPLPSHPPLRPRFLHRDRRSLRPRVVALRLAADPALVDRPALELIARVGAEAEA